MPRKKRQQQSAHHVNRNDSIDEVLQKALQLQPGQQRDLIRRWQPLTRVDALSDQEVFRCFVKELKEIGFAKTCQVARADAGSEPMKRLVRYRGLEIEITHNKGDQRFAGAVPMNGCCYGRLRGTYGKGEDGKAIDVYFGDLDTDDAFEIYQVNPETKEVEETKLMIGFYNAANAKAAFTRHAGLKRLGGVKKTTIPEIMTKNVMRTDKADVPDDLFWVSERAMDESQKPLSSWRSALKRQLSQYDSPQEALEALKVSTVQRRSSLLNGRMDDAKPNALEDALFRGLALAFAVGEVKAHETI